MSSSSDDDSTSSSSASSIEEYTPSVRRLPDRTQSMFTKTTISKTTINPATDSDDSSDGDSSDDEDNAKTIKRAPPVRKAPARAVSMPVKPSSAAGVHISETTLLMSKAAADMKAALKMSLDAASVHSRDSDIEPVIDFTADLDDFQALDLKSSVSKKKKKDKADKKDPGISVRDLGKLSLEAKKEERMERVRRRLEAEQDRKNMDEYEAKMKELEAKKVDTSEAGRRKRCWEWYSRTGMISREKFKEKVLYLPPAAALEEADVDLLPWNARGTMVNVAKLNTMLYAS